jgi:hypothetical protein
MSRCQVDLTVEIFSLARQNIWPHLGQKLKYEKRKQWMDRNLQSVDTKIRTFTHDSHKMKCRRRLIYK